MNKWTSRNVLWMLVYMLLYIIGTMLVCVTGLIHPLVFVCYQITAGILLTGIVIKAFDRVKAAGAALCLSAGAIIMLLMIGDANGWHVIPLIVIALGAEMIRYVWKYRWTGNVAGAILMTFSTFGYYIQIWFNRVHSYEHSIEEMPVGYADTLMAVSPMWALPVVLILGIVLSAVMANITAKLFNLEKQ